jgi:hypothetical protein
MAEVEHDPADEDGPQGHGKAKCADADSDDQCGDEVSGDIECPVQLERPGARAWFELPQGEEKCDTSRDE